jgi:hypothetical protein
MGIADGGLRHIALGDDSVDRLIVGRRHTTLCRAHYMAFGKQNP